MSVIVMTVLAMSQSPHATFLKDYAETRRFMAGRPVGAKVTPDGKAVLFLRSAPRDARQTLFELDLATRKTKEVLTPELVLAGGAEVLSAAEKARLERQRVSARGFTSFQLSSDGKRVLVALSGKLFVVERASGTVTALKTGGGGCLDPRFSPDGARVAYVREHDVWVMELSSNTEHRLTTGGSELTPNGLAEFVAQEEMSRFSGFWFSPDGASLAYQATDLHGVERFGVADPMKPEAEPERFSYPRPGHANASVRLGIVSVRGGPTTWVSWDAKALPYLATVRWSKNAPLTLLVQNREQTHEELLAVDAKTGATKRLLAEDDAAWLKLSQEFPRWLKDGSGFFWRTERNGGPEVELRKADGSLDRSWVKAEAGFDAFAGWDEAGKTLFFTGGADPTQSLLYAVKEGGAPVRVPTPSKGPSTETVTSAEQGTTLVVTTTSSRELPKTVVQRPDGTVLAELPSVAVEPMLTLELETLQLDAEPKSYAAVLRPHGFVPGTKYPVILQVYGGPGHQEVTQVKRENLLLQWLADQGFVVVKLDGRGTPRRGREWERAIKGDFATLIAADQLAGLKALGARFKELDLTRVGVTGWSFGGYLSALLALKEPQAVRCAVAGAPVVDWKDYDTHYTERYLGLPDANPKAYETSSLLTYVSSCERHVLLVHGTADDNVYFLHSLKLSDALFRAGKPHDVLPLTNFTHMVPEPVVLERLWERIALEFKERLGAPSR